MEVLSLGLVLSIHNKHFNFRIVHSFRVTSFPPGLRLFYSVEKIINFPSSEHNSDPRNTVYVRRVDLSSLAFSLSSHRHSYISLLFSPHFIVS
jgi:hypothetical protein